MEVKSYQSDGTEVIILALHRKDGPKYRSNKVRRGKQT